MYKNSEIPKNIYQEYLDTIFTIEGMKSAYSEKRRYIRYDSLTSDDIELILDAINKLIEKV